MKLPTAFATAAVISALLTPATAVLAEDKPVIKSEPGKATATRTRTLTATVTEVDAAKRTLTVKAPNGESHPMTVGSDVRNLDKVKVGDQLVVRYQEALSLTLKKDGKEVVGPKAGVVAARAASGAQPAGGVAAVVEVTADVVAVDTKNQIVTLKGAERTVEMRVADPAQLKLIKVGDQIQAVYSQELALKVTPAPAKK